MRLILYPNPPSKKIKTSLCLIAQADRMFLPRKNYHQRGAINMTQGVLSHLSDNGQRARFTTIDKNNIDIWFRQVAFNIKRGFNVFKG
jgi:hypothetical protein